MPYQTKQEIFTASVEGLAKQGFARSYDARNWNGPACRYHSPSGRGCAIGVLIPEGKYEKEMDQFSTGTAKTQLERVMEVCGIPASELAFCQNLQLCHDEAWNSKQMIANLARFSREEGLTLPLVLTLALETVPC